MGGSDQKMGGSSRMGGGRSVVENGWKRIGDQQLVGADPWSTMSGSGFVENWWDRFQGQK